jgi:hypothetical protein
MTLVKFEKHFNESYDLIFSILEDVNNSFRISGTNSQHDYCEVEFGGLDFLRTMIRFSDTQEPFTEELVKTWTKYTEKLGNSPTVA